MKCSPDILFNNHSYDRCIETEKTANMEHSSQVFAQKLEMKKKQFKRKERKWKKAFTQTHE